jgi:hypothetical protein
LKVSYRVLDFDSVCDANDAANVAVIITRGGDAINLDLEKLREKLAEAEKAAAKESVAEVEAKPVAKQPAVEVETIAEQLAKNEHTKVSGLDVMVGAIENVLGTPAAPASNVSGLDIMVAAAEKLAGKPATPAAEPAKRETRGRKKAGAVNGTAARGEIRKIAKERGVAWVRDFLASHGVERRSDLSEQQIADAVANATA